MRRLPYVFVLLIIGVACLVLMMTSSSESVAQPAPPAFTGVLELKTEGVTVRYPAGWSGARQANLQVLFNVPAQTLNTLDTTALANTAQITIFTERRIDHAEAVRRLKEIEAEATSPSTFLNIGSWPALQRRHLTPKPLPGQDSSGNPQSVEMVLQITTAVAAGDLLVRLESFLPENAPSQVADEVEAIGRSLSFSTTGNPAEVGQEIQDLRGSPRLRFPALPPQSKTSSSSGAPDTSLAESAGAADSAESSVRVTNQGGRDSEIEVAVSPNGRNIVIGTNQNYHFSTNGGQTWTQSRGINGNDPSVGWGQSGGVNGTFYAANIAAPSTGISVSTDNGAMFAFRANAFTCPGTPPSCGGFGFPDQEHIAVDRFNVTGQGDQVYSVWRQGGTQWGIVCSRDSGTTWTTAANAVFTGGDFPRITVGQDSFVYVVFLNGNNVVLSKFNSCEGNQNPMVKSIADQTVATGITHVACPTPGLDRCNFRNTLASPTVAVDDSNPNHIYVAYAVNTNPGGGGFPNLGTNPTSQNTANENIIVQDSLIGGTAWSTNPTDHRIVTISTGVTARRFMPWVCSVGGTAHVTWYDRRAASPGGTTVSNNSLTDFFAASAFPNGTGNLTAGTEFKVNDPGTTDAQCEAGSATGTTGSWPSAVDNQNDSESCSVQPQLGGICCIPGEIVMGRCSSPTAASTQTRCDFNPDTCTGGEQCAPNRGSPKYGDYNGNACTSGRFYMAWASAAAPASIAASTNIDTFFSVAVVSGPQIQVPGNVAVGDTCVGSTNLTTLNVCNTGVDNLNVSSISSSNTQFVVTTPSSGYPVVISPDFCFPFQVRFTPTSTGAKTTTLTIASNDPVNPSVTVQATGNGTLLQQIATVIADNGNFGNVCVGAFKDLNLIINNSGGCAPLSINGISSSSAEFQVAAVMSFPLTIAPGGFIQVPIRFQPTSLGPKTANITVSSNDPTTPSKVVVVSGNSPTGEIRATGSTDFGDICSETHPERTVAMCNVGACNLAVTAAAFVPDCPDFTFVNNPFPATVSPDSCLNVTIRYIGIRTGPKSCDLVVTSNTPSLTKTVTAFVFPEFDPACRPFAIR